MAARKPTKQLQECTPVHPNVPILGGIEGAMCGAFKGIGMTPSTDPTKKIPIVGDAEKTVDNVSKATLDIANTLAKPSMSPLIIAGIIVLLILVIRR